MQRLQYEVFPEREQGDFPPSPVSSRSRSFLLLYVFVEHFCLLKLRLNNSFCLDFMNGGTFTFLL